MDLFAPSHLLLLLLVILVIFGPSKLGDVGGALGKGIRDFKRAINEPDTIRLDKITTRLRPTRTWADEAAMIVGEDRIAKRAKTKTTNWEREG